MVTTVASCSTGCTQTSPVYTRRQAWGPGTRRTSEEGLLGGEQGKAVAQAEAQAAPEAGQRAGARSVRAGHALVDDLPHQVQVLRCSRTAVSCTVIRCSSQPEA